MPPTLRRHPHLGINALDAVQLTFAGINCPAPAHAERTSRVHGIVTNGGAASLRTSCRESCVLSSSISGPKSRAYLERINTSGSSTCAKGAALMTGASLAYHNFENSYRRSGLQRAVTEAVEGKSAKRLGVTRFCAGESNEASAARPISAMSRMFARRCIAKLKPTLVRRCMRTTKIFWTMFMVMPPIIRCTQRLKRWPSARCRFF